MTAPVIFPWVRDTDGSDLPETLYEWHLFGQGKSGGCAGCVHQDPDGGHRAYVEGVQGYRLVGTFDTDTAARAAVEKELS